MRFCPYCGLALPPMWQETKKCSSCESDLANLITQLSSTTPSASSLKYEDFLPTYKTKESERASHFKKSKRRNILREDVKVNFNVIYL